jgi:hypothetical protein
VKETSTIGDYKQEHLHPLMPRTRSRRRRRFALAALAAAGGVSLCRGEGRADPRCLVSVVPAEAEERWQDAARALEARLKNVAREIDCSAVTLEVAKERAFLVFTTRDGRQAVRQLQSPDELGPIVDALLVTLPPAPPAPPAPAVATEPAPSSSVTGAPLERPPVPPLASSAGAHVVFQLLAGGRVGESGGFVSPTFGLRGGVLAGAWEFTAFGQWDPVHAMVAGAPAGFSMSRYAVGVQAGRRAAVAASALAFGATTSIAVTNEVGQDGGGGSSGGPSAAEPLVGAYLALVYPRSSRLRVRPELAADVVATRVGHTYSIDPALPALPWWSASASIGIEWEVP